MANSFIYLSIFMHNDDLARFIIFTMNPLGVLSFRSYYEICL